MNKFYPLTLFIFLASSCAFLKGQHCQNGAAYSAGINDGKNGKDMNPNYASICDDQQNELNEEYKKGFHKGLENPSNSTGLLGKLLNRGGSAPKKCLEAYGKKKCGYNCIHAYGKIACASQAHHNCIEAYGQLKCGLNCREEYGKIRCD